MRQPEGSLSSMKKTVLVTGANSGFGYLIALKFARKGWNVFATTRDLKKEGVERLNKVAKEEGLSVEWLVFDVSNAEQIEKEVRKVKRLDVLVNNAGFGVLGPIESYTTEDFRKQFEANFFGVLNVTYAFLPKLKESGDGKIINMSSVAGQIVAPAYGPYSSSKYALEAYSEALRYEMADSGVKVSLVEPGGFETDFSKNAVGLNVDANENSWFGRIKKFRQKHFLNKEGGIIAWLRDPQRVADKVFHISRKRNPGFRYAVGAGSLSTMLLRKFLPDYVWELIVTTILRKF